MVRIGGPTAGEDNSHSISGANRRMNCIQQAGIMPQRLPRPGVPAGRRREPRQRPPRQMASKRAIAFASTQSPAREPLTGVSDAASEQAPERRPGQSRRPGESLATPLDSAAVRVVGTPAFVAVGLATRASGPLPGQPQERILQANAL